MSSHPLDRVLSMVEAQGRAGQTPVVVFDIDSTLIDTSTRQLRILTEFASHVGPSAISEAIQTLTTADMAWDIATPLRARGDWSKDLLGELYAFWAERFFHPDFAAVDRPSPGAVAFVQEVVDRGGLAYYLTGRVGTEVGCETFQLLEQWRFPVYGGRAVLHMKPSADVPDHGYKRDVFEGLARGPWSVVATFENEPGHANHALEMLPEALHFLVSDVHNPKAPPPHPEVVRVADFMRPL